MEAYGLNPTANAQSPWLKPLEALWQRYPNLVRSPFAVAQPNYLAALNAVAIDLAITTHHGAALQFVAADALAGLPYEPTILNTGQVPTRISNLHTSDTWHDFYNALMWLLWPDVKAAINSAQVAEQVAMGQKTEPIAVAKPANGRSSASNRLTLLDESGALVVCTPKMAKLFEQRQWRELFLQEAAAHAKGEFDVRLIGHGLLQKLQSPFKAITAQAWVMVEENPMALAHQTLDQRFATGIASLQKLQPLPIMGLPGWHSGWSNEPQHLAFYNDAQVFRP